MKFYRISLLFVNRCFRDNVKTVISQIFTVFIQIFSLSVIRSKKLQIYKKNTKTCNFMSKNYIKVFFRRSKCHTIPEKYGKFTRK